MQVISTEEISKLPNKVQAVSCPPIEIDNLLEQRLSDKTQEHQSKSTQQKLPPDLHSLKEDIDVSKRIVKALMKQAGKPDSSCIDIDILPPKLKHAVVAFINLYDAQSEYDAALDELVRKS